MLYRRFHFDIDPVTTDSKEEIVVKDVRVIP